MSTTGAIAAGLVWGWLVALTLRPAGRVTPAAAIPALGAALATTQQWWQSGTAEAIAMSGAIAAGFVAHAAWLSHLRSRAELPSR